MMMALRDNRSEQVLFQALDGRRPPRKWTRAATIAVGTSISLHLALVAYLYEQRTGYVAAPTEPDTPIAISWATLPIPKRPPATPRSIQHPHVSHALATNLTTPRTTTITQITPHPQVADAGPARLIPDIATVTPTPTRLITDPRWLSRPTEAEMSRFYPDRDVDLGLSGHATLLCAVVTSGKLTDCHVVSETPAGAKFGDAALKLAAFFRMTPRTEDGQPVDGALTRISITFSLSDDDQH